MLSRVNVGLGLNARSDKAHKRAIHLEATSSRLKCIAILAGKQPLRSQRVDLHPAFETGIASKEGNVGICRYHIPSGVPAVNVTAVTAAVNIAHGYAHRRRS
jgi:hypothetical protein